MKDITSRADLELLLEKFYARLLQDERMGYIFNTIAKVNLEEHLPHIVDFWEQSLFTTRVYKKDVLKLHVDLNEKTPLGKEEFSTWLNCFNETAAELFKGETTERLKTRALSIATIMQIKMHK